MTKKQSSVYVTFLLILTLFLVIATILTSRSALTYVNYSLRATDTGRESIIPNLDQLCQVTKDIEKIRRYHHNIEVNPSRQVIDELLEIVTTNSANLCMQDKQDSHLAVVLISTSRENFKERRLIRRTWGSVVKYRGWRVHTVLLLGQSDYCLSSTVEKNMTVANKAIYEELGLMEEFEKFGDLIVGAFAHTEKNNTYKHLMGYKFVLESCPEADLIIKTDDEIFVDVLKILDTRMEELSGSPSEISDILCHPSYQDKPTRCQDCPNAKWFSTREEWPENNYPQYCMGNDYANSRDWIDKIFSVRGQGGFFWVDDVFILGKLREIAETNYGQLAKRRHIRKNVTDMRGLTYVKENCEKEDEDLFGMFVFLQRTSPDLQAEVDCLWKQVLRRKNILTIKSD